jgi:alkylation response protein AidB-like acyl-CoA dehydrogenase
LAARIAQMGRLGRLNPGVASYVKLFRGTYSPLRARLAVDIGGPGAMTWDPADPDGAEPALTYLRGRGASIAGGTNETQRNVIGERALGLPREPSFDTRKPFGDVLRDTQDWTGTPLP